MRAELLGHLPSRVDDRAALRAGREGALHEHLVGLGVGLRRLAHVDGDAVHLDAPLLLHPAHRDGRVEAAAVGQHHALCHLIDLASSSRRVARRIGGARRAGSSPATSRSWAATASPLTRSSTTTKIVSSPATVPRVAASTPRSRAEATTWAQPGGVLTTTTVPELTTSTTHSDRTRRRCSGAAGGDAAPLGSARVRTPVAVRTLTAPSSTRSLETVAWVAVIPSARSSPTRCAWDVTGPSPRSWAIRCWRWVLVIGLLRSSRPGPSPSSRPLRP